MSLFRTLCTGVSVYEWWESDDVVLATHRIVQKEPSIGGSRSKLVKVVGRVCRVGGPFCRVRVRLCVLQQHKLNHHPPTLDTEHACRCPRIACCRVSKSAVREQLQSSPNNNGMWWMAARKGQGTGSNPPPASASSLSLLLAPAVADNGGQRWRGGANLSIGQTE